MELQTGGIPNSALANLKAIATRTGDLPPIPATALQALQMTSDPRSSVRDLQKVIVRDQGLAAKILRIVNSAMYCLSREVSTVSHAVAILGMESIRSIIMAASVQQVFQTGAIRSHDLGTKLLSDHSWGAAVCARVIAQRTGYENPEEAFLCGLMHDIGKPVLLKNVPERYSQIVNDVYRGAASFHAAELETFGFSHAHVGALLAEKWNFPPQLSEGIGCHHDPLSAPNFTKLACIANLANLAMIVLEIGFEKDKNLDLGAQPSAEVLKLDGKAVEELIAQLRTAVGQMPAVFRF